MSIIETDPADAGAQATHDPATDGLPPVIVLAGGLSHERDVSIKSGRRVSIALREVGHEVIESDVNSGLLELLASRPDAVVVPMLHGGMGEDGALQEVFGLLGARYVGATGPACRLTFDKSIATPVVRARGVRTPRQVVLPHDVFRELGAVALVDAIGERLGFPVMVKPTRSGSALGCARVDRAEDLPTAMVAAYAYGPETVVEEFVEGTEVAVAVIGRGDTARALPAVEIRPDGGVYDYAARYTAGATRFVTPAEVSDETARACEQLALTVHEVLGLDGIGRVDIMINSEGEPIFLEANVSPGMTETSLVPLAMEAAGLELGEVVSELVVAAAAGRPGVRA